ncbi:ROK family transcriptional regulator [Leifsonia sp. A12D58]|uniref:ROK family transcriptional regulator n=1 Tax=Leifsonia sp. A12D58 TaxID=3397674 RepID=UPI0039DFA76C
MRGNDTLSLTSAELWAVKRTPSTPRAAVAQDARAHNQSLILGLLHASGPMTRPQLAAAMKLSQPTVTALVADLLDEGMLRDMGVVAEARVGKPAARVEIDLDGNAAAVIDLSGGHLFTGAIVNLRGDITARTSVEVGGVTGDAAIELAARILSDLVQSTPAQVLGVGVASPGLVDDVGNIRVSDRLGLRHVDVAHAISSATGLDVTVGNDVNWMALGIRRFRDRETRDLLTVTIENGVGGAVILDSDLVPGEQFAAGEIGHVIVDPNGEECVCGRRGCLEQVTGASHLLRRIESRPADEHDALVSGAGGKLGGFLAPIVSMLNLTDIALIGPEGLVQGLYADAVLDVIRERLLPAHGASIRVNVYEQDADLVILGAASAVIEAQLGVR